MQLFFLAVAFVIGAVSGGWLWAQVLRRHVASNHASVSEPLAVESLLIDNQGLTAELRHEVFMGLANVLAAWFTDNLGVNYVEVQLVSDTLGPLIITVQRQCGFTPHEMRKEAERACAAVLKELTLLSIENNIQESPDVLWAQVLLGAAGYQMDDQRIMFLPIKAAKSTR